jgi:hypothetical protein
VICCNGDVDIFARGVKIYSMKSIKKKLEILLMGYAS